VPKGARITINLSESGDLTEAAAKLFGALRELDKSGVSTIAVMPIPNRGLGEAINDRLQRATCGTPSSRASDQP
jgi:L-threonylcarbamoyladenylate synthase